MTDPLNPSRAAAPLDAAIVRGALRAVDALDFFKVAYSVRGDVLRSRLCPVCGTRSRDAIAISADSGAWHDFAHGCSGDIFALVAGLAGLTMPRDFGRVVEIAAEIAGIAPGTKFDTIARRAELDRQRAAREQQRQASGVREREEVLLRVGAVWKRLGRTRRNADGERYLRGRGLDASVLIEMDAVRFSMAGDVCVPLWDLDGQLSNVVTRAIAPAADAPKVVGLRGCSTSGSLVGRLQNISCGAVLVEGASDALTAAQRWPHRVSLGAHGAGRMPELAAAAAKRIKSLLDGGKVAGLIVIGDTDDVGRAKARQAIDAAQDIGLVLGKSLVAIDLGKHHDLNAALAAGALR